ncbi:MAG TPA: helix-turn-helix transcriptional regulator [bacterium]|nr:helix-turn-helix transcriptional regulator [bacterium]
MTYLPLSYLLGSRAKVDILRILVSKQNYTGRKIATLSSTNPNSNKKALDFLLDTGLVIREHIGNAYHYRLNENHILYEAILNLFKEEERTISKIMKTAASYIEEYSPKTLAGFVTYLRSDVVLTLIAHTLSVAEMKEYIFEKTGFNVQIKVIDTLNLSENDVVEFVDRNYFWNNYKTILKMIHSRDIVKEFFNI